MHDLLDNFSIRDRVLIMLSVLIGGLIGYFINNAICAKDISKLTPTQYKFMLKATKEELKNCNLYNNVIDSTIGNYCLDPQTKIIKYYDNHELLSKNYNTLRDTKCIYDFQMKELFEIIFYKDKSKIETFLDKNVKGFSD